MDRGQCCCLASGGLPSIHPISSHFTYTLYVTGALPAVALVSNPRVGGFAYVVRPCRPLKRSFLKVQQFFPQPQSLLVFTARSYGIYLPGTGTLAMQSGLGLRVFAPYVSLAPKVSLPILSTTCECRTAHAHSTAAAAACPRHTGPHCISSPLHPLSTLSPPLLPSR